MARRKWLKRAALSALALFSLYMAAGYVSARIARMPTSPATVRAAMPPPAYDATVHVAGALAVHTDRSHDAVGSESEVIAAARSASLDFVVLTDHRSAAAADSLWDVQARYADGVLLVRGQEISLGGDVGRVLTIGLDTSLTHWDSGPDALARVLEGDRATAIVAHSRSPRVRDSWRPDDVPGIAGWEVFDLADIGRQRLHGPWALYHIVALVTGAPVGRTHHSILRLFREGFEQPAVAAYDSLYRRGQLTALAGLDAHPKVRLLDRALPGYAPLFKSLVNHVMLDEPLAADPLEATVRLAEGIEGGRVYISFGDAATARGLRLRVGLRSVTRAGIGGAAEWEPGLTLEVRFAGDTGERLIHRVIRDGVAVAAVRGRELSWPLPGPGAYRVEVYRYTLRVGSLCWNLRPWIFANPIRITEGAAAGDSRTSDSPRPSN